MPAGFLPEPEFRRVQSLVPILCVDVLLRGDDGRCLLIRRRDRRGGEGWNIVGGRVHKDESLAAAVGRHVRETLGPEVVLSGFDAARPDRVAAYRHAERDDGPFDPDQHAVSLNYVIGCSGQPEARGEALEFGWFAPGGLPEADEFGFNQGEVVSALLEPYSSS